MTGQPMAHVVGRSEPWQRTLALIRRLADSDRPVLITGQTGTGKEVAVQQLHGSGRRRDQPLLAINCAALPEALIEAQLFGHERGAFTGADGMREGFFAAVGEGTLFLDEIGELPLPLQPKLLRVLETRMFRPLGAVTERPFRGRIAAATHRDLAAMAGNGQFREDLFYRLHVFEIAVPTLEQRREDIPCLVRHFAAQQARTLRFTPEALAAITAASWPGNIRQLRAVIDRIAVLCDDDPLTSTSVLPFLPVRQTTPGTDRIEAVAAAVLRLEMADKLGGITKAMIDLAMRESAGNKSAAARLLGVHRKVVERQLQVPGDPLRQLRGKADGRVG